MTNLIMVGKGFRLVICLLAITVFYSCGNANVFSENDEKNLYVQIAFEDFFDGDILDLYINNKLVIEQDTLRSSFSDGITNTVLNVFGNKNGYLIDVHGRSVNFTLTDSIILTSVVLNGRKMEYPIDQKKGKYVGFSKNLDGTLRFRQSEKKPLYD